MEKATKHQQEILDLMADGWVLSEFMGFSTFATLQKGNETKSVSSGTVYSLWKKKLIRMKEEKFPNRIYELTLDPLIKALDSLLGGSDVQSNQSGNTPGGTATAETNER